MYLSKAGTKLAALGVVEEIAEETSGQLPQGGGIVPRRINFARWAIRCER